jgi:hypothetical protein
MTAAERTLGLLRGLAQSGATSYAVGRLVARRPELAAPAGLPVIVPRDEDAAFSLDRLAFLAWAARHLEADTDIEASRALHAEATWTQLGTATRTSPEQARARYGHLTPAQHGGEPR